MPRPRSRYRSLPQRRYRQVVLWVAMCLGVMVPGLDAAETVTVGYSAGEPGTRFHATFSWTVTEVLEHGTFVDGSPWVRVAAGAQLVAVSPQSEYRTTDSGFTVAVNGSARNPRMQIYVDPQTLSLVTVGKQLFDGRRIFLTPPSSQAALDATFDFAANIGMPDPATGQIVPVPLSAGDVVVTARSRWMEDGSFTWTEGGSLPNSDHGRRTAIDRFGVLTVLATAPTVPSFRPPLQWRPGLESTRPLPIPVSSVIGNESALLHSGGMDHTGVELLLTSPTFHDGHGILYQSSQAQYALSEDPARQGSVVYGANQAKVVMESVLFAATDASLASSVRVPVRNRLIQYGIDCYGVAMSLGNTKAGAGQRAAELKPWILLAGWWLGRAEMRDVFGSIRGMYAGTSVSGLSDGEIGRLLFHDDFVTVQVRGGMGLGAPYHQVWGPGHAYHVTGSSTAGSAGLIDSGTLFGQFGRMEIDGAVQHPGPHARQPGKYYGCSLVIEGGAGAGDTVYRVVEVGEVKGSIGEYVIVDRPWQDGGPDGTSTVRMFPFRNGDFVPGLTEDVGRWYFSTKGQGSMPGVDCLSPVADSYARVSFRAWVAPHAALKRLADFTGNRDYVRGNTWHLLAESIGGTGLSPVDGVRYGGAPDSERISSQIWSSWRHASLRPAELAIVKDWIGDDGTPSGFGHIDRSRFPGAVSSSEGDPGEPCSQIVDLVDGVHGIESRPGHDLFLPSGCSMFEVAWFRYTATQSGIVVIDTELGFDFDTALAVVSDCAGTQVFGCDRGSPTEGARVTFAAEAGGQYLIALGGSLSGSYGTALLRVAGPGYSGGDGDGDLGWDPDETIDFIPCELAPVIEEGLIEFRIEPGLDLEVYHSCLSTEAGFERIYNPVLMRFSPAENGRYVASLCGGTVVDTRMVVVEGCDTGTVIACSDDATDCWWTSEVTFDVTAGRDYILVIGTSDPEQYDTAYLNFHRIPDPPEPKRRLMTVGVTKVTWNGGTLSGITPMDVVLCDQITGAWSMWFDGSDVGLVTGMIDALARLPDGSLVMSFGTSVSLPGLVGGPDGSIIVDRCDLVRFVPTSLGWNTAGTWHFHLDGSDVGLLGTAEDIDALEILPDGSHLISTKGKVSVPGFANIPAASVLKFQPSSLGAVTAGTWSMHFDANDVGLILASENVDALSVGTTGEHCLSTVGAFEVTGAIGSGADGLEFFPQLLGPYTAGDFRIAFRGLEIGLGYSVKLNSMAELADP